MADMFETIDTCPVPVIARVHGAALGGGMGLCAVADLVIAESGTRFGFTETRLGILPRSSARSSSPRSARAMRGRCSPAAAGSTPSAPQRIGLVHEIVEGEEALDAAVDAAVGDLLAAGPTAARAAKAIVREVRGLGHGSSKWHTRPGHRPPARQRGGPGGLRGLRREAAAGLGARRIGVIPSGPGRRLHRLRPRRPGHRAVRPTGISRARPGAGRRTRPCRSVAWRVRLSCRTRR